jgi:hypothetical protein
MSNNIDPLGPGYLGHDYFYRQENINRNNQNQGGECKKCGKWIRIYPHICPINPFSPLDTSDDEEWYRIK